MNILIKSTYLLPAALLMLTACSQEEPTPTEPTIDHIERIHFRPSLPEATSRAQIVSNDNLTEFNVTVFNPADAANGKLDPFINNISVIKSEESDGVSA